MIIIKLKYIFVFIFLIILSTTIFANVIKISNIDCDRERLNEIEFQINDLKEDLNQLIFKHQKIVEHRTSLEKNFQRYTLCLREGVLHNITNVISTGISHISRENIRNVEANRIQSISSSILQIYDRSTLNPTSIYIVDDLNESDVDLLYEILERINSFLENDTINQNCILERKYLEEVIEDAQLLLNEYSSFKNQNKYTYDRLRILLKEQREILENCSSNIVKSNIDCENEIFLLERRQIYLMDEIEILKIELEKFSLNLENIREDRSFLELRERLSRYNLEYLATDKKIEIIKNQCYHKDLVYEKIIQEVDICKDQQIILEKIESLKKEMLNEDDIESIYRIRREIYYLEEKYNRIICNEEDHFLIRDTVVNERITNINNRIQDREREIQNLREDVTVVQSRIKNIDDFIEKENIIIEHSTSILEDTYFKLDKQILNLENEIENILKSNIKENTRDNVIKLFNQKIAALEFTKDRISNIEYQDEFKDLLIDARKKDILSRKVKNVSILKSDIDKINSILERYFFNHREYDSLKEKLEKISLKVNDINLESTDNDDFIESRREISEFRQTLENFYRGEN